MKVRLRNRIRERMTCRNGVAQGGQSTAMFHQAIMEYFLCQGLDKKRKMSIKEAERERLKDKVGVTMAKTPLSLQWTFFLTP